MLLGILKESAKDETRVALIPDAVKGLVAQGIDVRVERGAGYLSGHTDEAYAKVGAKIVQDRGEILSGADVLPVVNAPGAAEQQALKAGCMVIGFLRPLDDPAALLPAVGRGVTLLAMELVPRISRAQAMDALSSMGTVAGYKAAVLAADTLPRIFPMLMTAAGTIPPAKVFVVGAGVAGLQAIATARRLGAVVEAYDVRAAAGEQARTLGAKFLEVDLGGIETQDKGGYAKELTEEALERGRALIAKTAAYSDVVITTAQVPGRRAPLLVRRAAVEGMKPGAVLVDVAAPSGGNCELTQPGRTQVLNGVTLLAPLNLPMLVPGHASQLYSKNVANFLGLIAKKGALAIDWKDEILAGACVARDGKVSNERVAKVLEATAPATAAT